MRLRGLCAGLSSSHQSAPAGRHHQLQQGKTSQRSDGDQHQAWTTTTITTAAATAGRDQEWKAGVRSVCEVGQTQYCPAQWRDRQSTADSSTVAGPGLRLPTSADGRGATSTRGGSVWPRPPAPDSEPSHAGSRTSAHCPPDQTQTSPEVAGLSQLSQAN